MTAITTTQLAANVDSMWISMSTYLVFLMQAGFAFLEAGCVREKSVQNILIKNVLDICACTIVWWLVGYGFAYGTSSGDFIGGGNSNFTGGGGMTPKNNNYIYIYAKIAGGDLLGGFDSG